MPHWLAMATSLYDQLGGEVALRTLIDDFVERICNDLMIGFFFRDVKRERLK
jgi:truncated hemoglobin YjbI